MSGKVTNIWQKDERIGKVDNGWHELVAVAQWEAKTFTVSFNGEGGTANPTSLTVTYDSEYGTLPTATRTGYSFDGWYTSATGGTKIESTTVVNLTQNTTLHAHWKANKYTVTFEAGTAEISPKTIDETYDSNYVFPTLTERDGYNFLGWYTEDGTKVTVDDKVKITEATTLYAHWSYVVTTSVIGTHGQISGGANVLDGEEFEITLTPEEGYMIAEFEIDGVDKKSLLDGNSYTFDEVTEPHTVTVSYTKIPFALYVIGVDNAEINPTGILNLYYGDSASIFAKANPGYFIKAVKVNGKALDLELPLEDDTVKLENIQENATVTFEIEKEVYEIVEGEDQKYVDGKDLTFKFSGDLELFVKLLLNGEEVDAKLYTKESGSTIITLSNDMLSKLKPGTYTLTAVYENGNTAETTFTVEEIKNPATLDNICLYVGVAVISLIGLAGISLYLKKRFN
ncbi:MAG: InlB B-repeat-containing protein [bacterium]|nr:InlB B-repeat-containing protein [bacterium]